MAAGPLAPGVAMYAATALAALGRAEESAALSARALSHPAATLLAPLESLRAAFVDVPAGRIDVALSRMQAAEKDLERSDPWNRLTHIRMGIALILIDQGRDRSALECLRRSRQPGGLNPYMTNISRVYSALLHTRQGRLREAELELAQVEGNPAIGWRRWVYEAARAAVAELRGEFADAVAAAQRAGVLVAPGPLMDRWWMTVELAPVLARAGHPGSARSLLDATLEASDKQFPGEAGAFLRARLLALRGWLRRTEGDPRAEGDLLDALAQAGDSSPHLIRREQPRIESLLRNVLEQVEQPEAVLRAIEAARPGGEALLALTEHPLPRIRRAAIGPAAASGHPRAPARLRDLSEDADSGVATAARAALEALAEAAPPLLVRTLGGFEARRGSWRVDEAAWERPMVARLVRFLLVQRDQLVPEDEIFETFWPDKPPGSARRGLQVVISRARAVLDAAGSGESVLQTSNRAWRLRLAEHDLVDFDQFESAADIALRERGWGRRALLERAAALWTGEPLPEDRYEEWSFAWRERLVSRYSEVLAALAGSYTTAGEHPAAIDAARRFVEIDPLNESAHRELIVAYARAGRRGHALQQYLECRRALVDQLGVEPAEATSQLQRAVLAGEAV